MAETADIVILGAGPAGLTAADISLAQGRTPLCLETFTHVGGNHRSRTIGPYTFDIGSIVFYADFPMFSRFPGVRDLCVPFPHTFERLAPSRRVRAYPLESREIFEGGPVEVLRNVTSLALGRLNPRRAASAEDFCVRALGRRLYQQLGLQTYLDRFYGVSGANLELRFAEQRMQPIAEATRFKAMLDRVGRAFAKRRGAAADRHHHTDGLARPRDGFETMYGAAQSILADRGASFRFGVNLHAIEKRDQGFVVRTAGGDIECRDVISTIPVADTLRLIGAPAEADLKSSDLLTLYVSFGGEPGFGAPILYNFNPAGAWKRLTMHSAVYGCADGRHYFSIEIPAMQADPIRAEAEFAAFVAHVASANLFRGDLRLEGAEVTRAAYPTYTMGSGAARTRALANIENFGLTAVGRQGRFDYLPTTWHVMSQVEDQMKASDRRKQTLAAGLPLA